MGYVIAKKVKPETLKKYTDIYTLKVFEHREDTDIVSRLGVSIATIYQALKHINQNMNVFESEETRNMYILQLNKELEWITERQKEEKGGMNYSKLVEAKMKVLEKIMFLTGFSEKKGDTINNINGNVIIKREFHIHLNKPNGATSTNGNSGHGDKSETGDSPILPN